MVYRYETFGDDKGIAVLQSLKVSHLCIISNRFYESPKLKNVICELYTFSQIRSQILSLNSFIRTNSLIWTPLALKWHIGVRIIEVLLYMYTILVIKVRAYSCMYTDTHIHTHMHTLYAHTHIICVCMYVCTCCACGRMYGLSN